MYKLIYSMSKCECGMGNNKNYFSHCFIYIT